MKKKKYKYANEGNTSCTVLLIAPNVLVSVAVTGSECEYESMVAG